MLLHQRDCLLGLVNSKGNDWPREKVDLDGRKVSLLCDWPHVFMRGDRTMENSLYAAATPEIGKKRQQLAPETLNAWRNFSRQVFTDGALTAKTKDLIAIAVAHVTQCPYCIRAHTRSARQKGATEKEIMEAIWV